MNELFAPYMAIGALVLALIILYAALHEFNGRSGRGASLLAAVGAISVLSVVGAFSLAGGAAA